MSSTKLKLVLAGVASLLMASPALADVIVVKYQGKAAYKPGTKLPDTAKISLKAGESLTLLDDRGTRTLRGPGSFSAASGAAGPASQTQLGKLLSSGVARRSRTGAVRGGGDPAATAGQPQRSPNLWFVDVSKPGTICLADFSATQLWRADTKAAQNVTVTGANGAKVVVAFKLGQSTAPWPATLQPAENGTYNVGAISVTTRKVDVAGNETFSEIGSKLMAKGCTGQLQFLADVAPQLESS